MTGKLVWRLVAVFLVVGSCLASIPFSRVARAAAPFEHWGFYVTYDPASRASLTAHIGQLDTVVPDYFSLDADGTIVGADDPSIDALVRRNGKRLLPMVSNRVRGSDLSPLLNDAGRRQAAVDAISDLAMRDRFDGMTLDFEGVAAGDRAVMTSFVQALADALHGRGKVLAVALPAKPRELTTGWAGAFDDAAIGAAADRVILMAYAYRTASSNEPGPISPLPWVQSVTDFARSKIPADRLVIGIGVWGYDWTSNQNNPAETLRYTQTVALVNQSGGDVSFDPKNAAVSYSYNADGEEHEVWFENAASVREKIGVATGAHAAGVAFWRLGQEAPGIWDLLKSPTPAKADFAIPNGWFFTQTGGSTGLGYRVTDADGVRFWSEFKRLGGVATLGYPSSRRFRGSDGFTYQVFQRGVLQWRPELGIAYFANVFEQLSAAGWDARLEQLGIPRAIPDDGSGGDWNRAQQIRLSWLTNPAIAHAFYSPPNGSKAGSWSMAQSIQLYGLPSSPPVKSGPFIVQRFQRISLQLWVEAVPGMPAKGSVVGILGGDLYKQAGLVPSSAAAPETSQSSLLLVPQG